MQVRVASAEVEKCTPERTWQRTWHREAWANGLRPVSVPNLHTLPEDAWNFHIGGYHVCYKWLYDRRGQEAVPPFFSPRRRRLLHAAIPAGSTPAKNVDSTNRNP